MIALSTPEVDLDGYLVLGTRLENPYQVSRRGSVTATLDGGSVVYDTGASVSDVTVTARVDGYSRQQAQALRYLTSLYPELTLKSEIGVYAVRASFTTSKSTLTLQLRLLRRLDS